MCLLRFGNALKVTVVFQCQLFLPRLLVGTAHQAKRTLEITLTGTWHADDADLRRDGLGNGLLTERSFSGTRASTAGAADLRAS